MYCRKYYAKLDPASEAYHCPQCHRGFDPSKPSTYLARPFPGMWKIMGYILGTTIVSIIVASIVAFFQMAGASGH